MASDSLLQAARAAALQAHAPYSGYRVGCALVSEQGRIHVGCNVENASYGLTQCAERSAVTAAVVAEGPAFRAVEVVITVLPESSCFPPCGACRQVLAEFSLPETRVHWTGPAGLQSALLSELLPGRFELRNSSRL